MKSAFHRLVFLISFAFEMTAAADPILYPPDPPPPIPFVHSHDRDKSGGVLAALNDIFTGPSRHAYGLTALECSKFWLPPAGPYQCTINWFQHGKSRELKVVDSDESATAENLMDAVLTAGAKVHVELHMTIVKLEHLWVNTGLIRFADKSNWVAPVIPNIKVRGALADELLRILDDLGVNDKGHKLMFQCSNWDIPHCISIRGSEAIDDAASRRLWNAFKAIAIKNRYKPNNTTLEKMNFLRAEAFSYERSLVKFNLQGTEMTKPIPPPPPPDFPDPEDPSIPLL